MNIKISKLMGIGLTIAILASLLVVASPASAADPLKWNTEAGPSSTATGSQTLVSGSDVNDIAVASDGKTIYAVSSVGAGTVKNLFKSTNGGSTWSRMTSVMGTATTANITTPQLVAIAPDDSNLVMVVGTDSAAANQVLLSNDGGLSFSQLTSTLAIGTINAIEISPLAAGIRYVTVAGVTGAVADIWYLNLGNLAPQWKSVASSPEWAASVLNGTTVLDIAYSPNFSSDKVLVAVACNATGTNLEILSFSSMKVNTAAGFTNYPRAILAAVATHAALVLPNAYLGADEALRQAFVALTAAGAGGVFYMKDSTTTITNVGGVGDAWSVAYDGTNLVAGAATNNAVYYSANPTATTPTVTATNQYQRPSGVNCVKVAFAGTTVVAGTQGTNSSFAVSKDNGATFNDVSLIDTSIKAIRDVAVSPDAKTLFMVADDNTTTLLTVWRKTTSFERVLTVTVANNAGYIVRVAPEDVNNVYIANTLGTDMFYSNDSGEKSWNVRSLSATPTDVAVESAQVVYALSGTKVYKSTNAGFTWDAGIATGLTTNGATIISVKKDQVVVGSNSGAVAWSTDGSASATTWVYKSGVFPSGNVHLVADKLETGGYVYAVSDTAGMDVKRFKMPTGPAWDDIISGTVAGKAVDVALRGGVLYVLEYDPGTNNSTISRVITPTTATSATIWGSLVTTNLTLNKAPKALQATSDTDNRLWAINNVAISTGVSDSIKSFGDSVAKTAPAVSTPADKATPQTNPVSGQAQDMAFSWPRLSLSTDYNIQLALDSAFTQLLVNYTFSPIPNTSDPVVCVIGPDVTASASGAAVYPFAPGVTYYWRVKSTVPIESPWSTARSFTFTSLDTPFGLAGPAVGATNVSIKPILSWTAYKGSIYYIIDISEDPSFAIPEISHNVQTNLFYGVGSPPNADESLKYGTTYYWRVKGVTAEPYVDKNKVVVPAGPYAVGAFTTAAEAVAPEKEQIIITEQAPAPPAQIIEVTKEVAVQQPIPSWMLLTIIVIGAILVIALIVLIVRTRRVA